MLFVCYIVSVYISTPISLYKGILKRDYSWNCLTVVASHTSGPLTDGGYVSPCRYGRYMVGQWTKDPLPPMQCTSDSSHVGLASSGASNIHRRSVFVRVYACVCICVCVCVFVYVICIKVIIFKYVTTELC